MEIVHSAVPLCAVLVSFIAIVPIYFSRKLPNLRESWTIIAAFLKFIIILSMMPTILSGKEIYFKLLTAYPGIDIAFRVDSLGLFFGLTASFLWIITSFYSIGYVRALNEPSQTRYFICFAGSLAVTVGAAFSANLFTMYIFYEALTLFTYPLIAHEGNKEAFKGAKIYLIYLLGTSIAFLLPAIIFTYVTSGTMDFKLGGVFNDTGAINGLFFAVIFALYIAGIAKAGIMPFHSWLPSAMVAPTPVSALLHAVAVVKMGVFVVLRVVLYVFGIDLLKDIGAGEFLAGFACITIIVASLIAMRQDNIKTRLAYSTISQLSYIIVGVALLTPSGIKGSIIHIGIHAFSKISLFFWAGAVYVVLHKKNISELNGIAKKMPFSMAVFTIAALSLIGLPPLSGFISKYYFISGAIEADMISVAVVFASSSFLNALYFLPIIYAAYMKPLEAGLNSEYSEAPLLMLVPMFITASIAVLLFFVPQLLTNFADIIVSGLFG